MPFFSLKKMERDMGVCASVVCPHCQSVSRFLLRTVSGAVVVFGIPLFDADRCYQLVCSACKFRKDLETRELSAAAAAKDLYLKFEAHEINPEQYVKALDGLDFPSLRALREEAATWTCSSCGERVPGNFDGCWKCSSPRPGSQGSAPPGEFRLPPLPRAVTRPAIRGRALEYQSAIGEQSRMR